MFLKNSVFFILTIMIISCNSAVSKKKKEMAKDSISNNIPKVNHPFMPLNNKAKKLVEKWDEYQTIDELLKQYQHITTSLALLNAKELSELSKQLKDSIQIENLKIPAVKIRLNVLYNETLRLADMESIPSISDAEVIDENNNILNAYSALNLKINNIVNQENLNEEVNNFVEEVSNLNDTLTKVNSSDANLPKK